MSDPSMDEHQQDEELMVKDRRRFTPDGKRLSRDQEEKAEEMEAIPVESEAGNAQEQEEDAARSPEEEESVPMSVHQELEARAAAAEKKLRHYAAAYDQVRQEAEAFRGRLERDQEAKIRQTLSRTFFEILDALDNLERTFEHAEEGPLLDGVKLVHKQFLDILEAQGVQRIDVVGRPFDPEVSEAVAVTPAEEDQEKGVVVEEFRPGYRFKEIILRPAQVRVCQ